MGQIQLSGTKNFIIPFWLQNRPITFRPSGSPRACLADKIDEAGRKKNILIARAKRAEAQDRINQTMSTLSGNKSAFDTFERMAKKVDEIEAKAEAHKELEDLSTSASLEKQFAMLESSGGAGADAMLEDLKRKMLTQDAGSEQN